MEAKKIKGQKDDLFEKCVCCGARTEILRELEIHRRKTYVEGAGQLCRRCYFELYGQ